MDKDLPADPLLPRVCCLSGLLGSLLFLTGDMLWYGGWTSGAGFHSHAVMAQRPDAIIILAAALGPVAALFSAVGMGIFFLTLEPAGRRLAATAAALLAVMMLIGGAYHALYGCFGFTERIQDASIRQVLTAQVAALRDGVSYPMYAAGVVGTLLVYALALTRRTRFPRWLVLLLPTTLSEASTLFHAAFLTIPAPLGGWLLGGWINGSFVLFFAIATPVFWRLGAEGGT